jgi:hypothetical protein
MRWILIVAVLVGCDPCSCEPSAEIKARAAELSNGFKSQAAEHHSKTIAAIESTRQEIVSQNEQIIDTLKIVEASLVDSKSVRKEDDQQSAVEPQEVAKANPSQSSQPVASPPAVRLFVTHAPFACPPCERLKRAVEAGEFEGFEVVDGDSFSGLRSYPAIRFETPTTTTGWGVVYGFDNNTIPTLRALTQGTSAPPVGAIFPVQAANTVTSSRSSFRSFSRWLGFNRGSRTSTRQSCPSGRCPQR